MIEAITAAFAGSSPVALPRLPSLEQLAESNPAAFIGPLPDRQQAREWALVLQSQGISYIVRQAQDEGETGIVLQVSGRDYERGMAAIELYEIENENWPPPRYVDRPRHEASIAVGAMMTLITLFFVYVTGPVAAGSRWFAEGRADAVQLFSEPWRMVTALTLHADAQHVLGNTISGAIFGAMLSRRVGAGGAILAFVVGGTLGNAFNALHHLPGGHRSIGASTAVFAMIGMIAAVQTVLTWGRKRDDARRGLRKYRFVEVAAPLVGGLTLLGTLGAGGGNVDVWAHGYGFLAGAVLGAATGLFVRRREKRGAGASTPVQLATGALAAALLAGSWVLALGT